MKAALRFKPAVFCLLLALALPAGASEQDPWEGFNRRVFAFNEFLDRWILKPLATGYNRVAPEFVNDGISNFFSNLDDVIVIANDLFQLKGQQALRDTGRLGLNTTVGFFGFIDVASSVGLTKNEEDFGQTLGYWGAGSGPYLVLPLFGPSSVRDAIGKVPDYYLDPLNHVHDDARRYQLKFVKLVDIRAGLLDKEKAIVGDRYTFLRNAYLQRREYLVNDGKVEEDPFLDDEDYDDDDW